MATKSGTEITPTALPFETRIDLDEAARSELTGILNQQLADTADLHSQVKQAHWNVKGIHFQQLHELFDQLAASIEPYVDTIAERVTALGGVALGTVRMAAEHTTLPDYPADLVEGREHLEAVTERWAAYAASTRAAARRSAELGDAATEDLFIEVARTADLGLYFLESHLQG